jgi:transposase
MEDEEMGEIKKRNIHSAALKAKVGLQAFAGVQTINEIGKEHGVHPMQVRQWKALIGQQAATLFEGKRGPKANSSATEQSADVLYSQIGRLKVELDWLKKKSGINLP